MHRRIALLAAVTFFAPVAGCTGTPQERADLVRVIGGVVGASMTPILDELAARGKIDEEHRSILGAVAGGLGTLTEAVAEIPTAGTDGGPSGAHVTGGILASLASLVATFFAARRLGERRRSRGIGAVALEDRIASLDSASAAGVA